MYFGPPYAYKESIDPDDLYKDYECSHCDYNISRFLYNNNCSDGISFFTCSSCNYTICSDCEIPRMGRLYIHLDKKNDLQRRAGLKADEFLVWSKYVNRVKRYYFKDINFKDSSDPPFFGVINARSREIRQVEKTKHISDGDEIDEEAVTSEVCTIETEETAKGSDFLFLK